MCVCVCGGGGGGLRSGLVIWEMCVCVLRGGRYMYVLPV